jgi:hypothetical protein
MSRGPGKLQRLPIVELGRAVTDDLVSELAIGLIWFPDRLELRRKYFQVLARLAHRAPF